MRKWRRSSKGIDIYSHFVIEMEKYPVRWRTDLRMRFRWNSEHWAAPSSMQHSAIETLVESLKHRHCRSFHNNYNRCYQSSWILTLATPSLFVHIHTPTYPQDILDALNLLVHAFFGVRSVEIKELAWIWKIVCVLRVSLSIDRQLHKIVKTAWLVFRARSIILFELSTWSRCWRLGKL